MIPELKEEEEEKIKEEDENEDEIEIKINPFKADLWALGVVLYKTLMNDVDFDPFKIVEEYIDVVVNEEV
jgi:hypothetical protein